MIQGILTKMAEYWSTHCSFIATRIQGLTMLLHIQVLTNSLSERRIYNHM